MHVSMFTHLKLIYFCPTPDVLEAAPCSRSLLLPWLLFRVAFYLLGFSKPQWPSSVLHTGVHAHLFLPFHALKDALG